MTILYGCLILEENMINTLRFSRNLGSRSETFDSWNDSKIRETKNTFTIFRSSRPEVFCKKGVLRNSAKFTGKYLCQRLFLIKLQASALNNESRAIMKVIIRTVKWFKQFLFAANGFSSRNLMNHHAIFFVLIINLPENNFVTCIWKFSHI